MYAYLLRRLLAIALLSLAYGCAPEAVTIRLRPDIGYASSVAGQ